MKKTFVVASLLAVAPPIAPVTSAFARGRHDGGHHRGGLVWGLANAVVATAVAVVTLPIAIAAAVAQAPRYYGQGPTFTDDAGPYYALPAPSYYGAPGAPAYYSAPPVAQYYGPAAAPAAYRPPRATLLRSGRPNLLRSDPDPGVRATGGPGILRRSARSALLCFASGLLRPSSGLLWSTPRRLPSAAGLLPTLGARRTQQFSTQLLIRDRCSRITRPRNCPFRFRLPLHLPRCNDGAVVCPDAAAQSPEAGRSARPQDGFPKKLHPRSGILPRPERHT